MIHLDKFEHEVTTALQELRIPAHFRGYEQIKTAMKILRDRPEAIHSGMALYKSVGIIHYTNPKTVETNIRTALQSAKSDFTIQKRILGTNRELTNREFLATLAEVIRIKLADVA